MAVQILHAKNCWPATNLIVGWRTNMLPMNSAWKNY